MPNVDFSVPRWLEPPNEMERARIDEATRAAQEKAGTMIKRQIGLKRMQEEAAQAAASGVDPITARKNALFNNAHLLFSDRPEEVATLVNRDEVNQVRERAQTQLNLHRQEMEQRLQARDEEIARKNQAAEVLAREGLITKEQLAYSRMETEHARTLLDMARAESEGKGYEPNIVGVPDPTKPGKLVPVLRTGPKTSQMIEAKATKPALGEVDKAELKSIYKRIEDLQTLHDQLAPELGDVRDHPKTLRRMRYSTEIAQLKERARALEAKKTAPAEDAAPAAAAPSEKRVRVKSPDGKVGSVPESQLEEALKAGYSKAE